MSELRFETTFDEDVDGAVLQVGLLHYPIGPARPAIRINTGAVELTLNVHSTDIDTLIAGLKAAKKLQKKTSRP